MPVQGPAPPPRRGPPLVAELWMFLRRDGKLWMLPLVLLCLLIGVVAALGSSPLSPLVYTLF